MVTVWDGLSGRERREVGYEYEYVGCDRALASHTVDAIVDAIVATIDVPSATVENKLVFPAGPTTTAWLRLVSSRTRLAPAIAAGLSPEKGKVAVAFFGL